MRVLATNKITMKIYSMVIAPTVTVRVTAKELLNLHDYLTGFINDNYQELTEDENED